MTERVERAVAVVGVGAVLPDAPDAPTFWDNIRSSRYSISDVPAERWNPGWYYDPDPKATDKTYSKIGGWVRDMNWDPLAWRLPIPPRVGDAMDSTQKLAISAARQALEDYGYPERHLDPERTAVIIGNAMAGDRHYLTAQRIAFPSYAADLELSPTFASLDAEVRSAIVDEFKIETQQRIPGITEDTMPGELANIIAGRVANIFNFRGPNFVTDAACASALAGVDAAIDGLENGDYDAVVTGGIDANMSPSTFVKFCKIGALSSTGTRPYGSGADGFVMGEGGAIFVLKRLKDAEADGDRIYAVIRGVGGSSDGRGKGITAPNPVGQRLALMRAWQNAGATPDSATLIEGHGTSTKVGDVVEVEAITEVFSSLGLPAGSIPLGSVKSNIGHLKAAAGAAGMLKAVMALDDKVLPPSLNADTPNPNIDFQNSPLFVNTEMQEWKTSPGQVRRAGVSAFGFGGTNFHVVLEEHIPGRIVPRGRSVGYAVSSGEPRVPGLKVPLRGALLVGSDTWAGAADRLRDVAAEANTGFAPPPTPPASGDLHARCRVAIDYGDAAELARSADRAVSAIEADEEAGWDLLSNQGIFRGEGPMGQLAFLYTGQGSQYVNMLADLREIEPIVADTFDQADAVMSQILRRPLSEYIFVEGDEATRAAEIDLMQTEITQPAVLAVDTAITRLFGAYGVKPDMVMGHSLGEYGALIAANALPFDHALEAVAGRGREMARVSVEDKGLMAAVFAPIGEIERTLENVDGYVVVANINSTQQAVVGGSTAGVEEAVDSLRAAGHQCVLLPVSHAFHTEIVSPASAPLEELLERMDLRSPSIPLVANVTGDFYPRGPQVESEMVALLGRQIYSPVQFVKGLETLYNAGARVFVEVGPKRALHGFVQDVLSDKGDVAALFGNHPKSGGIVTFNRALCGLYAAGIGAGTVADARTAPPQPVSRVERLDVSAPELSAKSSEPVDAKPPAAPDDGKYLELGHLFADFLDRGRAIYEGREESHTPTPTDLDEPVVITGAGLGLPGMRNVFEEDAVARLLHGEQFIDAIPLKIRQEILEHRITRLVKTEAGGGHFQTIDAQGDVIKLAGRAGVVDLEADFGFPADRAAVLDRASALAIGAGIDAMRDAGIPLVMRYKSTTTGTKLPDRWMLPESLRDDTGVIFASAFPGVGEFGKEVAAFEQHKSKQRLLDELQQLRSRADGRILAEDLDHRIHDIESDLELNGYEFDRSFLYRILSFGHAQFAEYIGARGPNTQINAACASTTQAVSIAEDWIRQARCSRVIIISGDDASSDEMLSWIGSGFLAVGAAATDEMVEDAATPFDRRRHGMIVGMGAAALVVESSQGVAARGMRPIAEVLSSVSANSAFHGSRLDTSHIRHVMEQLVCGAEDRWGIDRRDIAPHTMFVSHETYTPARGGSAQAEVDALRFVFGAAADEIVITNTKGYTGHAMAVGIEDVLAIKALETGIVPAVPNHREVDPDLGSLNLSRGGSYDVTYALRLGAGFGSQVAMSLLRSVPSPLGSHPDVDQLGFRYRIVDPDRFTRWLSSVTGYDDPAVEIVKRTLRVADQGVPAHPTEPPDVSTVGTRFSASTSVQPQTVAEPVATASAPDTVPVATAVPGDADVLGVEARVLEIVAGETGYPSDMLDLDLDLEADLGIDTVKQAEMFAAIRSEWGIERDDAVALRDYPTLAHVIGFVTDRVPDATPPEVEPAPVVVPVDDGVEARVLEIVTGETGYPSDMLDLDLDLEADLGIDTVKQAEMFAAIRSEWGIERDDAVALRDYPTLAHVIGFVTERVPDATPPEVDGITATDEAESIVPEPATIVGDDEASAAIPRRLPTPLLRPDLSSCVPTGVVLDDTSRVVVMTDSAGVGDALVTRLSKRGAAVLVIDDAPEADDLLARLSAFSAEGAVTGVYWLSALDVEPPIASMDLTGWREGLRRRVKLLYETMRHCDGTVAPFLISATRLGGQHGYGPTPPPAPMGGAVTGFTKAYKRENPEATVKAVDFPVSRKTAAVAEILIAETLNDPGAVEIGRLGDDRWTIGLRTEPLDENVPDVAMSEESVFVVTGAAGSIVSAITADLAKAYAGTFHLIDLVPEPDRNDPDIAAFRVDRDALKRDILGRLKDSGERATPALVEQRIAGIERASAALEAIEAVEAAGGTVHYHAANLLDASRMKEVTNAIVDASGRVDVLIHAGGLEISHLLDDKDRDEYDLVFDVKADGWFNLLQGFRNVPIGATVAFSSVAGRFGNSGQTDYSAANDLLCKTTMALPARLPGTNGIVIDWTAWGDIGMATRGSIPTVMKSAGIDILPAPAGIPVVRRELPGSLGCREVVVGQRLGMLTDEWHETGGFDAAAHSSETRTKSVMVGKVDRFGLHEGLVITTTLDPSDQPFLHDHQIDGVPVLPGVMGIEGFAAAAVTAYPEFHVGAIEDVNFLAPFKFYRHEPRALTISLRFDRDGEHIVAECELRGSRVLPGHDEPQVTTHFTGRVRLSHKPPDLGKRELPAEVGPGVRSDDVYQVYFHGPAYQVLDHAWATNDGVAGAYASDLPANHTPSDLQTVTNPRLLELCFQTAGLTQIAATSELGLPLSVGRLRTSLSDGHGSALVDIHRVDEGFEGAVVDDSGRVLVQVEAYETVLLPGRLSDEQVRPIRAGLSAGD